MDVVQTRQRPGLKMFINNYEKVLTIEKSAPSLELVLQQLACKKVNTAGTDETIFRLVPVLGHGRARCQSSTSGASAHAPAPSLNGAQVSQVCKSLARN